MNCRIKLDGKIERYYAERLKPLCNGGELDIKHVGKVSEVEEIAQEILYLANTTMDPDMSITKDDAYKFIFTMVEKSNKYVEVEKEVTIIDVWNDLIKKFQSLKQYFSKPQSA